VVAVTKAAEEKSGINFKNIKINNNNNNNKNFITIRNLIISKNYINHIEANGSFYLVATLLSPLPTLPSGQKKRFLFPSRIMTSCVKTSSAMKVSENNKYVCIAAADHGCLSAQSFFTVETSVTASGRMVAWMKLVLPLLKYD